MQNPDLKTYICTCILHKSTWGTVQRKEKDQLEGGWSITEDGREAKCKCTMISTHGNVTKKYNILYVYQISQ